MPNEEKILQRGIFTIKNQELNAYVIWKDIHFFSQEKIEEYQRTGKTDFPIQEYALIFNDIWKAQLYLYKTPALKGSSVYDLSQQSAWEDFKEKNLAKGINEMILNRCLLKKNHECALLIMDFNKYETVEKLKENLLNTDYCPGGYNYEEFYQELTRKKMNQ